MAYGGGAAWYANDVMEIYNATQSGEMYPFLLGAGNLPATAFSIGGALYWFAFGLDRSGTIASIGGYVAAGAHMVFFAYKVWLGPLIWAMNNLVE